MEQVMAEIEMEENQESDTYFTEFGKISGPDSISILDDYTIFHVITCQNPFDSTNSCDPRIEDNVFSCETRYSSNIFQGVMPVCGAAGVSTAEEPQFYALQKMMPSFKLDKSTAGLHNIRFGKGSAVSLGTANVPTPFGNINFHIVPTNTPFLLCTNDMDKFGIKFDNTKNVLEQGKNRCAVTRKWGHPWLLLDSQKQAQKNYIVWSNLTET